MINKCSSCDASLANSQGTAAPLCLKCRQRRHRQLQFTYFNLVAPLVAGTVFIFIARDAKVGWLLLNIALLQAFGFFTTIIHEGGHACVAGLLRMRVWRIVIGAGKTLWEGKIFGVSVILNVFALGGGYTMFSYPSPSWLKVRYWLVIVAGPLANLAVVALLVWSLGPSLRSKFPSSSGLYPGVMFVIANFVVFVANLFPFNHKTDFGRLASDGLQLIRIPFTKKTEISALIARHFHMESAEYLKARDFRAAREAALQGIKVHNGTDIVRASLLNQVAWCDLLLNDYKEADYYATEALRIAPENWAIKGTLGSVLAELGQYDRAIELLTQSCEGSIEKSHKAENLYYLAIAYHRRGDTDKSIAAFQEAESLDSGDPFHERARMVLAQV